MARGVQWRREVSEACCWHQTEALEATIYLLRQTGPTGFLLKEDGQSKTVKVYLGDSHTCTCPVFKRERDLCKHICWLLLKKFKLSINDPLSWQLGLVERELNEILQGRNTADTRNRGNAKKKVEEKPDGKTYVQQRAIAEDDVCPICQEELLSKKLPVTYCKFSCGNTMHIKCMTVWAEHQQKSSRESNIKCPMCREDFGPIELLKAESRNAGVPKSSPGIRLDRHVGIACSHCLKAPIEGKCYRCTVCPTFHMCQRCFNFPVHTTHSFQFRQKTNQRWRAAVRNLGAALPSALVNDLMNRDISEDDYDTLLQLDRNSQETLSSLTEEAIQKLPLEKVRERSILLAPGSQCRVCLHGFTVGQTLRKLPCGHKFHIECIDGWLLHSHPTCPIDGLVAMQPVEHSRSVPRTTQRRETQGTVESREPTHLLISATGVPYATPQSRGNSGTSASNSVPNLRRPPPCLPLRNISEPRPGGLELSGARLGASVTASPETTTQARNSRVSRHIQDLTRHRMRNAGDQHVTTGDLVQFLQGYALQPTDLPSQEFEDQSYHPLDRRPSAGSEPAVPSGAFDNELGVFSGMGGHRKRSTLRKRPSSAERTVPSIRAITSTMNDLYLGNNPITQPPTSEDRNLGTNVASNKQLPRHQNIHFLSRRLHGLMRAHTPHGNLERLQLEGSAINGAEEDN